MSLKKSILRFRKAILIASVAGLSVLSYGFVDQYFEISKNLDIFSSTFREVNLYYVDPVDPGKLMRKSIDEMLSTLDPYTNFIPESDMEDYRFMTTGQYGGIGAVIRQRGDYVIISDPYEGYPAQKAGLIPGDRILKVDDVSVKGKKTDEVSRILKGSPQSKVKLVIQRGDADPEEKIITREEIKVKSVPYSGVIRDGIGYIRLNSFTEGCGRDVAKALKSLKENKDLKGIILDLRDNPGGLLTEAVNVTNVFVPKGVEIVSTKGKIKDHDRTYKSINEPVDTEIPLTVLVNSGSASASEIVAGALQDLDRAVILGRRTFGKGLVQTTRQLSYNAQLKITTAKYYIPSGRCIQALDYAHRNEDGSVGKVPDSLMKPFKTAAGRTVYDGGGILPDIVNDENNLSMISKSLIAKNLIFDYATRYYLDKPVASVNQVDLTDTDYKAFTSYLSDKEYDYMTKSEESLEQLKKNLSEEEYMSAISEEYESLRRKLSHDKKADLEKNKSEIIALLEEEIASRYQYQSGRIREALTHDEEVDTAIAILREKSRYKEILAGIEQKQGDSLKSSRK